MFWDTEQYCQLNICSDPIIELVTRRMLFNTSLTILVLTIIVSEPSNDEPDAKKQKTSDEDELFALSLVPSLKRLSAKVKSLTKIKILQQLAMAEFGIGEDRQRAKD